VNWKECTRHAAVRSEGEQRVLVVAAGGVVLGARLQWTAALRTANVVPQVHRLPLLPGGLMQREEG
jgi:hypothetical protein